MSMGITSYVRSGLDINSVDECSQSYQVGEATDVAFEVGSMGLSAGLKALAKNVPRAAARRATQPFLNAFRKANNLQGGFVHHANPLFGNPGRMGSTMFPTGGMPAWLNSGAWNLQWMSDTASHMAAHSGTKALEDAWLVFVNPGTTVVRTARDIANN